MTQHTPSPWKLRHPFSGSEMGPYPTRAAALDAVNDWYCAGITYRAVGPMTDHAIMLEAWAAYEKTGMTPSQLANKLNQ